MGGKGSKQRKSEPQEGEKTSPLDHFTDGAIVFLTCKASGKLLRIHEEKVDGLGEEAEVSQFTVHKKDSESGLVVTLQSVAYSERYVKVCEGQVGADGTGDEHCELKVVEIEGCVKFKSVKTSGHYVAVQEDGTVQTATEVSPAVHFTPSFAVKQETAKAATPPADEVVEDKADEKADEKADDKPEQQEEVEDKEEQSPTES